MRVVLVHDWLTGMRGGERVLERLCALFPEAPIFTLVWKRGSITASIEAHPIHVSFLQLLPDAARRYRWYLPLFPAAIESMRLPPADAVISSSHAVAKGIRVPPGTFHLSYIHTPMRYVWELQAQYFPPGKFPWPLSTAVDLTCARLRRWDVRTSVGPDALVANSAHVAARIARHYRREAAVVHPPVALGRLSVGSGARDYFLVAGALAPYKRADLALEACQRLGLRLVVAGSGQDEAGLRRLAAPGIEFRGWVDEAELAGLYAGARALLFPGEEDFGIVPLEAMACGCPVVAYGRGGALETVGRGLDRESRAALERGGVVRAPGGILFGTQSVEGLSAALAEFERQTFDAQALRALAKPFDEPEFDRAFRQVFDREYRFWQARGGGR